MAFPLKYQKQTSGAGMAAPAGLVLSLLAARGRSGWDVAGLEEEVAGANCSGRSSAPGGTAVPILW